MTKHSKPMNSVTAVSLVGSASILKIAFGLLKMKVAAVLLGPAGVGLIGLFQQLMTTVSTLFGLGIREAGTRQVADANGTRSESELAKVRRALFWGAVVLGLSAALFLFLARDLIAHHILQTPLKGAEIGWLAVGAALTVAAGSQQALLNGLRQVRELALITVLTGALSTLIGVAAMLLWREYAVIIFVLSSPFASFVMGHVFVARLPRITAPGTPYRELSAEFTQMARLGSSIMLAALVVAAGHLTVRTLIQRDLGVEALGLFTAAWLISQYYIGFLYTAITMDYYPRLTAAFADRAEATRIINQQTEISLLFAAPLFLGMMSLAPYALWLLYTEEFIEAADVLRWFIVGDILKVLAYPLGFALLAAGAGKTYFLSRFVSAVIFVAAVWLLLSDFGLNAVGIAYIIMNLVHFPLMFVMVRRYIPFFLSTTVSVIACAVFVASVSIALLGTFDMKLSASIGILISVVATIYSFNRLSTLARPNYTAKLTITGKKFSQILKRISKKLINPRF